MLKLGTLQLEYPYFQAPLSGYSDYAMRAISRKLGCPFSFAGVMLAKSVANPRVLRKKEFQPHPGESMVGGQILGREPEVMAEAARGLESVGFNVVDLNFACPAPKVLRRKRGGALMGEPELLIEILKRVKDAVKCPVTMKIRAGLNSSPESKEKFWQIIESSAKEGIDAIAIHGRTVSKPFRGDVDRNIIGEVRKRFPHLTIIGSGDLFTVESVVEMINQTGIDGALIARGAIGNPWIFRELKAHFSNKPIPPKPDLLQQRDVILEHLNFLTEIYRPSKAVRFFRKFLVRYCKFHPQRKKAQLELITAKGMDHLKAVIDHWYLR